MCYNEISNHFAKEGERRMKRKGLFLTVILLLAALLVPAAYAADKPVESSNLDNHYYVNAERWATPITSTLSAENGGYLRVEYVGDSLVVELPDPASVEYFDTFMCTIRKTCR
jgi:hypothetical protein